MFVSAFVFVRWIKRLQFWFADEYTGLFYIVRASLDTEMEIQLSLSSTNNSLSISFYCFL